MSVSFVHCTPDAERMIVKIARVSNPTNADNWDSGPKLLRYLIAHQHWSPFEMASLCVQIETERDIAAQILRHRSFSFQEFSSRYAQMDPAVVPSLRRQAESNRQSSSDDLPQADELRFRSAAAHCLGTAYGLYEAMLLRGVARETARRILPLCTPTTLYMHGVIRSWIHYIQLRTSPDTQLEHREIAQACRVIFTEQFPVIAEAAFSHD